MTTGISHDTPADGTFSAAGKTHWEAAHLLTETGGQALTIGAINNGQYLKRSGTTITSGTPPATTDLVYAAAPNSDFDLTAGGAGGNVNFVSQSVTGVAVGDQVLLEVWYTILNNSGGVSRTYTPTIAFGGFTIISSGSIGAITSNASNKFVAVARVAISVSATNLCNGALSQVCCAGTALAAGAAGALGTTSALHGWNTTASDMTGTNTLSFGLASNSTTTTQTLTLNAVSIRKISAT